MANETRKRFSMWALLGCVVLLSGHGISTEAATRMPERFRIAAARLVPLHRTKTPAGPDDWLATHHERGQTAGEYARSNPNRPTQRRTKLYVQPIGEFTPAQMKLATATAELLGRYYNIPTKLLQPLSLDLIPTKARRRNGREQILTSYVLHYVLEPRRPADAVAVLGLMTSDLWPGEGWNFVFGEASLSDRVGVWSIARYGDLEGDRANVGQVYRRTFLVAVHETGHMLGMPHCTAYECTMNGSNSMVEADRAPMWLCPECVQKVWWACHADPVKRYQSLVEFANQHDLKAEAEFWQRSADRLTAKEPVR